VDDPERFREALTRLMADEALRQRFRRRLMEEMPRRWADMFGDFERCVRTMQSL
jgi:hypothetical protein